jgi:hypothetical protein
VENPEEAVDPNVDARRLQQGVVIRIDLDPAFFQEPGDRPIRENHGTILRPPLTC